MSHLQIASDAPILLRAAAGTALYAHIGGAQPKAGGLLFHGPTVNLQWIPVAAVILTIAYWLFRTQRAGQRKSPKANRRANSAALEVMS